MQTVILTGEHVSWGQADDCMAPPPLTETRRPTFRSGPFPDHDCYHPEGPPVSHQYRPPPSGLFARPADAFTSALPGAFHLAHAPGMAAGPVVLNDRAWERWQMFQWPSVLREDTDHRLAHLRLLHPLDPVPTACSTSPGTLTAWLHISNACNLECPYCYIRKSSERMSLETGRRAVEAIFRSARRHGYRQVLLKYAGGEATLHFSLIRQLHAYALEQAKPTAQQPVPIDVSEVVLSNGVHIRPEDVEWLAQHGVRLTVSLDGVGALHNTLRPMKNRPDEDTFGKIERTIDRVLRPHGIAPHIAMTVTGLNAHGAADVARWAMIARGLTTSFSFYRPTVLSRSRADLQFEEQTLIDGMLAAYDAIESDLPLWPFLNGLLDRVKAEPHTHTCGAGRNYLVITHAGALAQCQMHVDQPVQPHLGGDLLGAVATGPLRNLPVSEKEGCRACSYRHVCAGGCPLETFRATGRWDVRSPNCHIYQALLPAAWRLEGLRLLKTHGYLN